MYWIDKRSALYKFKMQQGYIPVGCVPSAAVAAGGRGGVSQHALSMVCVCVSQHAPGRGVSDQGCVSAWGGVCPGGVCHTPPVNRITDACENITLLQLVTLRMVTRRYSVEYQLPACRQSVLHSEQF